jgi:hypothetical protein
MRADDAASDYTFTVSGTFSGTSVAILRFGDASTNTPVYSHATGANSQTQTCPDVTTVTNNSMVVWVCSSSTDTSSTANKGDERVDEGGAGGTWMCAYTNLEATAGTITGATITTVAFGAKRMFSFAVESAAVAGGFTRIIGGVGPGMSLAGPGGLAG